MLNNSGLWAECEAMLICVNCWSTVVRPKVMTCDFIFYTCSAVISVYRCIFHVYYSIRFYVYVVFSWYKCLLSYNAILFQLVPSLIQNLPVINISLVLDNFGEIKEKYLVRGSWSCLLYYCFFINNFYIFLG